MTKEMAVMVMINTMVRMLDEDSRMVNEQPVYVDNSAARDESGVQQSGLQTRRMDDRNWDQKQCESHQGDEHEDCQDSLLPVLPSSDVSLFIGDNEPEGQRACNMTNERHGVTSGVKS